MVSYDSLSKTIISFCVSKVFRNYNSRVAVFEYSEEPKQKQNLVPLHWKVISILE